MTEVEITVKLNNTTQEKEGETVEYLDNEAKERTFYVKNLSRESATSLLESIGKKVNELRGQNKGE